MRNNLPVILLLTIFFILVITSVSTKSPVCDAAAHHIATAYSFVKTGDFRMNPCAPPLLRLLMGLPLLPLDLKLSIEHPSWQTINSSEFSYQFLFVDNRNDVERIVFLSRLPMILVSTLLGFAIFLWSKKLYGYKSGLFALFLYVFSPTILANAGLAMLDAGCTCFMFLAVFQLWRYLKQRNLLNLVLTGICFGLAQSTKISSIILYPLSAFFILFEAALDRKMERFWLVKAVGNILTIWLIGLFILWSTYFFEFKPLLQNAPDIEEKTDYIRRFSGAVPFVNNERLSDFLIHFAKSVAIPLSTYIVSLLGVLNSVVGGQQRLVFMGRELFGGSKIYYIVNFLIKTPLPIIFILILSVILYRRRTRQAALTNFFLMLPAVTIFGLASFSKLQGGLRYIMPIYPFLFVWLSDIVNFDIKRIKLKMPLVILSIWYLISSVLAYPHYLAYFNELTGGPKGFGYKITTDMDWGQDFKVLKEYLDKKGVKKVKLYCFGTVDPSYYGIDYEEFKDEEFDNPIIGAYYAISSRFLRNVKWTNDLKPIDRVAHTIFIYHIETRRR